MNVPPSYVSIALINFGAEDHVSVVTVSVLAEECVLSGAWSFSESDSSAIFQVLSDRLLIVLGDRARAERLLQEKLASEVSLSAFLQEAGQAAKKASESFNHFVEQNRLDYVAYMAIKPADRKLLPKIVKKNLVQPSFYNWPEKIDLEKSSEYFKSVGKLSKIKGTPPEMETVISASRAVKLFVDMWHLDEQERIDRPYIEHEVEGIALLPKVWLNQMALAN